MEHYFSREDVLFAAKVGGLLLTTCLVVDTMDKADAAYKPEPPVAASPVVTHCGRPYPWMNLVSVESEGEDANEEKNIQDALLESGYLRSDVPLSYDLQAVLRTECEEHGIDFEIALALIEVESNFQEDATSRCGAYGLMQLNPAYFPQGDSVQNIQSGIAYLSQCIERGGSLEAGLTAYNAGYDTGDRAFANSVLRAAEAWKDSAGQEAKG